MVDNKVLRRKKLLNNIWPIFIIISIIYAIIAGNLENLNLAITSSSESAVSLTLTLIGTTCLWSGLIEIASNTNIIKYLKKFLRPVITILFPNLNSLVYDKVTMNIISNILGLGNAATPLGLQAMEEMQKENLNKEYLSDNMMILIILNTSSLQIIPTTIIAIRTSLGSNNPTSIIFPVCFSTICAGVVGVVMTKLLIKIDRREK